VKNTSDIFAVFDCNILIQASANSKSPASACFRLAESKTVRLFVSESTLQELELVLYRDYIKERFKFTDEVIGEFLDRVRNIATVVKNVPKVFSLPRDVDDEIYINLAVEADADFIVTHDKDLIDLMSNYDIESKQFRQKFRPLKIVQPLEFLRIVEEKIKDTLDLKP
jgi:putative PIN family toxin of toxin-antitoxin system